MRVLSMTPEQINALPPTERSAYIQLVSNNHPILSTTSLGSSHSELHLVSPLRNGICSDFGIVMPSMKRQALQAFFGRCAVLVS
jgi:hypothetical protein